MLACGLLNAQQSTTHVFSARDSVRFVGMFEQRLGSRDKAVAVFKVLQRYRDKQLALLTGKRINMDALHTQLALADEEKQKALHSLLNARQQERLNELMKEQTTPAAFAERKKQRQEEREKRIKEGIIRTDKTN